MFTFPRLRKALSMGLDSNYLTNTSEDRLHVKGAASVTINGKRFTGDSIGGLCNAETAIAVSIHKTSRVMFTALKVAAFLAVLGLAFYAYSQLPLIVIPNAN